MRNRQPLWRVLGMALGLLLVQLAWALCVPPFVGIDEWDHAFRADSVAHGQWRAPAENATRGTGAFVTVSPALVAAAAPECAQVGYTTEADCAGTATGDRVAVASGAGRYNPAFYAFIGWVAMPFEGGSALYAMRAAAGFLTLLLFVVALLCVRSWAQSAWPFLAIVVGLTPTVLYSSMVAAPNGVELTAGLAWWSALMGLVSADVTQKRPLLLSAAAASGSILVTVRSLGPLWMGLALIVVLISRPGALGRLGGILRTGAGRAATGVLALTSAASVMWVLSQRSLKIGIEEAAAEASLGERLRRALEAEGLWAFQAVAAFPRRSEPAPVAVYPLILLLLLGFLFLAFRRADRRLRTAMFGVLAILAILPFCMTVATYNDFGVAWQGRYGLPFGLGLAVLVGVALNREASPPRLRTLVPCFAGYLGGQLLGPLELLKWQRNVSPGIEAGTWVPPETGAVMLLFAIGFTLLWFAASWTPKPQVTRQESV